ncbi:MAG: efflux RND transporter periplasmic adaptor subunit [Alphaproteobacteria bacterium]|uniref:Efflux RND transporter periplasmic adaptor subunit n=1 Tax=Candidatus Nitrobium versatile TaxID=2884831 RepID=A0A953JBA5_9BACT|nr:efflux RND transporter periplasmic adaptor subunit [Candidatus Nitrobium versatile]
MKKILFVIAGILLIGTVAFALLRNKETAPKFRTERIGRGEIQSTVTATGTVNPVVNVQVGTQVSGTIKDIYADFNTQVKKGQLIARIDPATFEAQVAQARANLFSAQANLEKAEITRADAKRTMERSRELVQRGFIARSELESAETNYGTSVAQVSAAKAQVAQTEAALKTAGINLRYTRIISPVDGTVVSRNVDVGQTVAASFQTPTLFTIARDLTRMQINSNVAEADIGRIRMDQPVEFTVDAHPDITFKGRVAQVRNAPITVQNVVTYDVVINVDNSDLKLKPGMTANISVVVENRENIIRVPNAALRFRLPEEGKKGAERQRERGKGVWVLENNKPKRVKVTTGISDGAYTELVSGDIGEGREVIVESLSREKRPASSGPRMF